MAGASLLTLLDDIASILDDVSLMTKVAAKKTAGVLGDDLALNAEQVSGVRAERELPVVWAVAKGSFVNKAILVPAALAISALAPWAIVPLLMVVPALATYRVTLGGTDLTLSDAALFIAFFPALIFALFGMLFLGGEQGLQVLITLGQLWPVLLIIAGVAILVRLIRRGE